MPRSIRRLVLTMLAMLAIVTIICAGPGLPSTVRAADLFTELRSFPGVVLLPPADLSPFSQLEPWRVELNRPRPGSPVIVHGVSQPSR